MAFKKVVEIGDTKKRYQVDVRWWPTFCNGALIRVAEVKNAPDCLMSLDGFRKFVKDNIGAHSYRIMTRETADILFDLDLYKDHHRMWYSIGDKKYLILVRNLAIISTHRRNHAEMVKYLSTKNVHPLIQPPPTARGVIDRFRERLGIDNLNNFRTIDVTGKGMKVPGPGGLHSYAYDPENLRANYDRCDSIQTISCSTDITAPVYTDKDSIIDGVDEAMHWASRVGAAEVCEMYNDARAYGGVGHKTVRVSQILPELNTEDRVKLIVESLFYNDRSEATVEAAYRHQNMGCAQSIGAMEAIERAYEAIEPRTFWFSNATHRGIGYNGLTTTGLLLGIAELNARGKRSITLHNGEKFYIHIPPIVTGNINHGLHPTLVGCVSKDKIGLTKKLADGDVAYNLEYNTWD